MIPVNKPKHINSVTISEKIISDPKYIELTTQKYFLQPVKLYKSWVDKIYRSENTHILMHNPNKVKLLENLKTSLLNIKAAGGNIGEHQELAKFLLDGGFGNDEDVLHIVRETLPDLFILDSYAQLGVMLAIKEGKLGTDDNKKFELMEALADKWRALSPIATKKLTEAILNSGTTGQNIIRLRYPHLKSIFYACYSMPISITNSLIRMQEKFIDEKDFLKQLIACICVNPTEDIGLKQKEFINIFSYGNPRALNEVTKMSKTDLQRCFNIQIQCLLINGKMEEYPDVLKSFINKLISLPVSFPLSKVATMPLVLVKHNTDVNKLIINFLSTRKLEEEDEQMIIASALAIGNFGTDLDTLNYLAQQVLGRISNKKAQDLITDFIREKGADLPAPFFINLVHLLNRWGYKVLIENWGSTPNHEEIKNQFLELWKNIN